MTHKEHAKTNTATKNSAPLKNAKKTHTQYHCHQKNTNNPLNKTTIGKIDRRTIRGRGTPQNDEEIYQGRITYNTETNKWTCNTCGEKYDTQCQQNAIQHACKHFTQATKQQNGNQKSM